MLAFPLLPPPPPLPQRCLTSPWGIHICCCKKGKHTSPIVTYETQDPSRIGVLNRILAAHRMDPGGVSSSGAGGLTLSCSSPWQPPQRRQLPAVSSHINPQGDIRAKWLLLRGDRFDSHSQQLVCSLTLYSLRCRSVPNLYRVWNHRAVSRLRGLSPRHPPHVSFSSR